MSRALWAWVGLAVVVGIAITAGCGDSGSGDTGETVATTTGASGNERLTSAQWTEYETSRGALRTANAAATATLKKCSATSGFQDTAELQACVGDTFTKLTKSASDSLATLESFDTTVSGSCAEALADLTNYVGTFQASAAGMQRTIDSDTLAGYPAASQDLEQALSSGRAEAATFEQECAPA
jgi:hypothetical protein